LRNLDDLGGIRVYTVNLLDELLALDRENEYVLFHRNPLKPRPVRRSTKNVREEVVGGGRSCCGISGRCRGRRAGGEWT